MTLYEIVKSLQDAQGNISKQNILNQHKDNSLFKAYMKAVYDPAISYYQSKLPKECSGLPEGEYDFDWLELGGMQHAIAERQVAGNAAKAWMVSLYETLDNEGRELLKLLLDRSIGASVGDTMVLRTWPNLFFVPPYMRCSLMTPKIKKYFEGLDKMILQKKADGSFLYLKHTVDNVNQSFTRVGTHYPKWFADKLAKGAPTGEYVFLGELVVYKNNKLLDRATGNGICNSILKGGDEHEYKDYSFLLEAWDVLPTCDFESGLCEIQYERRLEKLEEFVIGMDNVQVIETDVVDNLEKAYSIYSKYTAQGLEGAVIKCPHAVWKDHTSPYNVKLKIKFEAEYKCVGIYEGEGKAKGMLGGISVESSDGLLECNCGSGFSDAQRKAFWKNPEAILQQVVTLEANDIVKDRDERKKPSLFLPIFIEVRNDKNEADSFERVQAQLEAAKQGV